MNRLIATLATALVLSAGSLAAAPQTFKIDPVHSGISFKIRHFFNNVPGSFGTFSGTITFDPENLDACSATATIAVGSVDTRNENRDKHLQNEDFFKSDAHPEITFASTKWEPVGENSYRVIGDLTMVGVTKPVVLQVKLLGVGPGRGDTVVSGWSATTLLDRRDWGLSYGQGIVGNDVEVELEIQGHLIKE